MYSVTWKSRRSILQRHVQSSCTDVSANQLTETLTVEKVKEMLRDIIVSCFERADEQEKADDGHIKLERGFATIPFSLLMGWCYAFPSL
jgi:hypothetical protein